jgi:hypothetical protein
MFIITALRDFANGLSRGLGLYFTERNDFTERAVMPALKARKTL